MKCIYVSSSDELNNAISIVNNQPPKTSVTIGIMDGFTLSSAIPAINATNVNVTIQSSSGSVVTLDGGAFYPGFIILNGSVVLQDILIANMMTPARATSSSNACMGAGAGLFVASTVDYPDSASSYSPVVVLNNVSFSNCVSMGSDGIPNQYEAAVLTTNVFGGQAELGCFGVVGVLPGYSGTGTSGFGAGSGQNSGCAAGFGGDNSGPNGEEGLGGDGLGFGGGLFVMDNANVTFTGSGSINSNTAEGPYGSSWNGAGSGIFLQGSGVIKFEIESGETYTISDEVTDETGAVSADLIPVVVGTTGPDGLPTGGGTGVWTLNKTGHGTLAIPNNNVRVKIIASEGVLDLSGLTPSKQASTSLNAHVDRKVDGIRPKLHTVSIAPAATLRFNAYSRHEAHQICFTDQVTIVVDDEGFAPNIPVQVMSWQIPLDAIPTINSTSDYTCVIGINSITIVKKS